MDVLRTPDERFAELVDYPFAPHYCEVDADPADAAAGSLRMHYVDEAAVEPAISPVETVVCLHGEPSWSYLYRNMIPMFAAAGMRCVAPDLVGFGRSDKPASRSDYTYDRHVAWLGQLLFEQLDLHDITLVCQDWGGLLGLRLVGEHPERFARVVAANTFLPPVSGNSVRPSTCGGSTRRRLRTSPSGAS
jgi:haloalkane dehalogenase